jgi:hypothetical protein
MAPQTRTTLPCSAAVRTAVLADVQNKGVPTAVVDGGMLALQNAEQQTYPANTCERLMIAEVVVKGQHFLHAVRCQSSC